MRQHSHRISANADAAGSRVNDVIDIRMAALENSALQPYLIVLDANRRELARQDVALREDFNAGENNGLHRPSRI
jgi:hypothetical protein